MESRRIAVNGIQMGVTLYSELYKRQQTLVLLHGFTGSAANWADVCTRLESTEDARALGERGTLGARGAGREGRRYTQGGPRPAQGGPAASTHPSGTSARN